MTETPATHPPTGDLEEMKQRMDGVLEGGFRPGDRVEVQRGGCTYWSHAGDWAPDGTRGTVDGSWKGHPGADDEHLLAVSFTQGHLFVAEYIFRPEELILVRRARRRSPQSVTPPNGAAVSQEGERA